MNSKTQAETILAAKTEDTLGRAYVDQNQLINWQVKAGHLISMVCGQDSHHLPDIHRMTALLRLRLLLSTDFGNSKP